MQARARMIAVVVGAAVLVAAHGAAGAEPARFYVSGGIGAGYAPDGTLSGAGAEVDFDLGRPIGIMALGLEGRGRWRFELDFGYRYNDAEVLTFRDGAADLAPDSESRIEASSLALGAIRDFDLGRGFRPYLGAGLGAARVDYEISQFITGIPVLDDADTVLAWHVVAGFGLPLTSALDLLIDYRYWRASDIDLEGAEGTAIGTDHEVHSALASLRYHPGGTRAPAGHGSPGERRGWYLRANGGPSFAKDAEIKDNIANFDAFDVGGAVAVAVGRAWGPRWRVEVEGARRSHEPELIDFNPEFGEERAEGRVRARSLMANAIYKPAWVMAFQPYAGLGLGMARSDWDVRLQADDATYVDDRDSAGALQVIVGAEAALTRRFDVTAEYRYWMTGLFDLEEPAGRPMRTELTVHSLMLGVRYTPILR